MTVADGANQPLTILKVLVGGLAIDAKSGLWISPLHGMPSVPRLFPFDLIYLDEELRVLHLTEFVPGAEFPPYHPEVTSALILPPQSLQTTQTRQDDLLLICPAEEMDRQIAALHSSSPVGARTNSFAHDPHVRPSDFAFDAEQRTTFGSRFAGASKAGAAVAVADEVPALASPAQTTERGLGASTRKKWPLKPAAAADSKPEIAPAAPRLPGNERTVLSENKVFIPKSVLAAIGIEPATETVAEAAVNVSAPTEASGPAPADAPVISITELILERPRAVDPPAIIGVRGEPVNGDIEDLFSNWMDAPSLASSRKPPLAPSVRQSIKSATAPAPKEMQGKEANTAAASPVVAGDVESVNPRVVQTDSVTAPLVANIESGAVPVAHIESVADAVRHIEQVGSKVTAEPAAMASSANEAETLSSLKSQTEAVPVKTQKLADEIVVEAKPELSRVEQSFEAAPALNESQSETGVAEAAPSARNSAKDITPPKSTPAGVEGLAQPRQAPTSTVAQYGMWRASLPTAVMPVASQKVNAKEPNRPVEPSVPPKETAKSSAETTKLSTSKASEASPPVKEPVSPAPAALVEVTTQGPAATPSRGSVDARSTPSKERVHVSNAGMVKAPEAVSRRPVVADDFFAAKERRQPLNKAAAHAAPERSAAEEFMRPAVGEASNGGTSAPAIAVAPEAVDMVQRRLGIGQANGFETPATEEGQKTELAKAEISVPIQLERLKSVDRAELVPRPETAVSSQSPMAPKEIETAVQNGKSKAQPVRAEGHGKIPEPPRTLAERFKRWINPEAKPNSDRRRAHRRYVPGMVAHYYTGGAPKPHDIADISMTGFYLLTEDRWMPDTMIQMTLQKPCANGERKQSITVLSRIVRRGSDGVAAQFVMPESLDPHSHDVQPSQTTDRFALARFI